MHMQSAIKNFYLYRYRGEYDQYGRKALHQSEGQTVVRYPSNHNLGNVSDVDGMEFGEERGHHSERHFFQQQPHQHPSNQFDSTNASSIRLVFSTLNKTEQ